MGNRRITVGVSGAFGFQYGMKTLTLLRDQDIEVHLVVTKGAEITHAMETHWQREQVVALAYEFLTHGLAGNLLTRAEDVILKERRHLILM